MTATEALASITQTVLRMRGKASVDMTDIVREMQRTCPLLGVSLSDDTGREVREELRKRYNLPGGE